MGKPAALALAEWCAGLDWAAVPPDQHDLLRARLLDTAGLILAGHGTPAGAVPGEGLAGLACPPGPPGEPGPPGAPGRGAVLLQYCQTALQDAEMQVEVLEKGVLKAFETSGRDGAADDDES